MVTYWGLEILKVMPAFKYADIFRSFPQGKLLVPAVVVCHNLWMSRNFDMLFKDIFPPFFNTVNALCSVFTINRFAHFFLQGSHFLFGLYQHFFSARLATFSVPFLMTRCLISLYNNAYFTQYQYFKSVTLMEPLPRRDWCLVCDK